MNILEEYEILSVIGEGTFGVVKLGKIKKTDEEVAIKILEKKKIVNKDDEERVEREIEILKKVHHINVIKMIKIDEDNENIYLIMEYCEKGELFNHIVEEQKLDEIEAAFYYYQLINGLECIHHNEIVHRDLKPENLLLTKGYILKIIDFGLSNYFNRTKLLSTPCGSPCYASPEMVSGKKYDGFMIDIWSTGIILYAMLCGYLPFEDPDNEILFQKILKCEAEFPDDLSYESVDLMKKIMVTNPKERITIPQIKEHPFYLKGKEKFKSLFPNLIEEVEKDYSKKKENGKKEEKKKDLFPKDEDEDIEIKDIKKFLEKKEYSQQSINNKSKEEKLRDEFGEKLHNEEVLKDIKENEDVLKDIKKQEKENERTEKEKKSDNSSNKKKENSLKIEIKKRNDKKDDKNELEINFEKIEIEDINNKSDPVFNINKTNRNNDELNIDINNIDDTNNKIIKKLCLDNDKKPNKDIKEDNNKKNDFENNTYNGKNKNILELINDDEIGNAKSNEIKKPRRKENRKNIIINKENINDNIKKKNRKEIIIEKVIYPTKENNKNRTSDNNRNIKNKNEEKDFKKENNKNKKTAFDFLDKDEKNYKIYSERNDEKKVPKNIRINIVDFYSNKEKMTNLNKLDDLLTKENKTDIMNESDKNISVINKQKNSNNIPNLKNVIKNERTISKNKNVESLKQKIAPKKVDSLSNDKKDIKKDKTNEIKIMQNSNFKNRQIMKDFRLTDNEIMHQKENINLNSSKKNYSNKADSIINSHTEVPQRRPRKIPPYNYNFINSNKNRTDNNQLLSYNNTQRKDNSVSLNIFNLSNNIYAETISTFSNSIDKLNPKKIQNFNSFQNQYKFSNNNNISNYSQKNAKTNMNFQNIIKISDNNVNKNIVNLNNYTNISEYNQKTYNKNLNPYKIRSNIDHFNSIQDYQNTNSLPNDRPLYSDILYKRKFNQNSIIQKSTIDPIINKNNNILYETKYSNNTTNNNINKYKSKEIYNTSDKKENINLSHKKNISNYYYPIPNNKNEINKNLNINLKTEGKPNEIISRSRYNNIKKNHNYYDSSLREINNLSNNINTSNKKRLDLNSNGNSNKRGVKIEYLMTNANRNINSNNGQELNVRLLGLISNSAEKFRNYNNRTNYNTNNVSPINLYLPNNQINNMIYNRNSQTISNNYLKNISNDNNTIKNIYNTEIKNRNTIQYNANNKLVKKGIIHNYSKRQKDYNSSNQILIDNRGNIYNAMTKPSYKYLSNYNINENKYSKFNKTQTSIGDLYNKKRIYDDGIQTAISNNNRMTNINYKNDYKTYIKINNNKNETKKINGNEGNKNNIKENINKPILNNNYYSSNIINKNNNQIKNNFIQIINNNTNSARTSNKALPKNSTNKGPIGNILTKINKVPINNKRNKNMQDNSINNNYKIKEISRLRDKTKPISFLNPEVNSELSSRFLMNNNTNNNLHHKQRNVSDSLINNNSIENSRKTLAYNNRQNLNSDKNYKNIIDNNIFQNYNRSNKINLYGYKQILKKD